MAEEISVGDAIKQIQNGEKCGKDLPKELLREVIQVLRSKGQEQNVIAKFLGYSDRQLRRLLLDIRKANRFKYSEDTRTEHIGWFVMSAQSKIDFLTRTYNSAVCSEKEKILACIAAWKVAKELTESLQSLGVLPSAERAIHVSGIYGEGKQGSNKNLKKEVLPGMEGYEELSPSQHTSLILKVQNLISDEIATAKAENQRRMTQEPPPAA